MDNRRKLTMQNHVMAGIEGIKLTLDYDPRQGNVRATVKGYPHTVAVLPMNSEEAVLTSNGMLAYRDRTAVKAVIVTNHKEIIAAVRKAENDARCREAARQAVALQTLKDNAIQEVAKSCIGNAVISSARTGEIKINKVDISKIPTGKITVRYPALDLGNEVIDSMRHEIRMEFEKQIRMMARRIAEDRKTIVAHEKTIRELVAKVNKAVGQHGTYGLPEDKPEIDRTCTDNGGLFTGPTSFADDNPFVNRSRGKA